MQCWIVVTTTHLTKKIEKNKLQEFFLEYYKKNYEKEEMQKEQYDTSYREWSCGAHNPTNTQYWPWTRDPHSLFGICITCATYSE